MAPETSLEAVIDFLDSTGEKSRDLAATLDGGDRLALSINSFVRSFESLATDTLRNAAKVSSVMAALDAEVQTLDDSISKQAERVSAATGLVKDNSVATSTLARAADAARSESAAVSALTVENESFLAEIAAGLEALGKLVFDSEAFMSRLVSELSVIDTKIASLEDISERLNVLAINTAIEAARAGERGKGFAIISKEMQSLSKTAFAQTKVAHDSVSSVRGEVGGMSSSLTDSRASVQGSLDKSRSIVSRFRGIRDGVRRLDAALGSQAAALAAQREAAGDLTSAFDAIDAENVSISEMGRAAERLSSDLEKVVSTVIEGAGKYRTGLHRAALAGLEEITQRVPSVAALFREPDPFLRAQFERHPGFELLYLMDSRGEQVSSNVVNPQYAATVTSEGRGKSWSQKPYFALPARTSAPYISDIYLSVASRKLCLTVSVPLFLMDSSLAGVLAADLNVGDMARIAL